MLGGLLGGKLGSKPSGGGSGGLMGKLGAGRGGGFGGGGGYQQQIYQQQGRPPKKSGMGMGGMALGGKGSSIICIRKKLNVSLNFQLVLVF